VNLRFYRAPNCCGAPLRAQVPAPPDTVEAIECARDAATESPVGSYFLAGLASAPLTVGSVIALAAGDQPKPWMARAPIVLSVTIARSSRSNLPLPREMAARLWC
jgi:hypothetical protein